MCPSRLLKAGQRDLCSGNRVLLTCLFPHTGSLPAEACWTMQEGSAPTGHVWDSQFHCPVSALCLPCVHPVPTLSAVSWSRKGALRACLETTGKSGILASASVPVLRLTVELTRPWGPPRGRPPCAVGEGVQGRIS